MKCLSRQHSLPDRQLTPVTNFSYVPKTRSDLGIPKESETTKVDYAEYFEDTPIYTLFTLVRQQLLAFPAYMLYNVSGQKHYPKWCVD